MSATSGFLNLRCRSLEEAEADRIEARQGGWPQRDRKIAMLEFCMRTADALKTALENAEKFMEVGNDFGDELAQLEDIKSNLRIRIEELR